MNNFDLLYPLRRIHGIVHEWLEKKKKKWGFILYICYPLGEKYYVLGAPQHTNLGDSAIVLSEISFLKQCRIREKRIKEVTTEEYKEYKDILKTRIGKSDKIFLHGGGNMGDQWFSEECLRRDMLSTFGQNKIIIFPQTIFYSDTTEGKREEKNSIPFYNRKDLTIVAREYMSFERMKYLYPNANVLVTADIVLSTNRGVFGIKQQKRMGILLCLRSDMEKAMSSVEREIIEAFLQKNNCEVTMTDMYSECAVTKKNRYECVKRKMNEFTSARLVITDRLHGMVFAAITGTPCIVFGNYNYKVEGTYEWIKYLPYIRFVRSTAEMEEVFPKLLMQKDCEYDNKPLQPYFEKLEDIVKRSI